MNKIAIGIPTYKRSDMLKKLILSILGCKIDKSLIKFINIIVIDNDIDRTAENTVKELTGSFNDCSELEYYNYPKKGLSNVRNELFKRAIRANPDYIICIDDDEYPSVDWLNELLLTITATKSDIVLGPVIPEFENGVSPYISYWFKYKKLMDCQKVNFFWTGNFIICTDFLLRNNLKFDERFNSTGSEDSYFGVTALKSGASICWSKGAVVYETIPLKRARLKWLIKRSYNGAVTYNYILRLEKNNFGLLKKTLISIAYFLSGLAALVLILLPIRWKYWGMLKISESFGGFAGLFGAQFHEYAKDR